MSKQLFSRVSVGDKNVCDDCAILEGMEAMTWNGWQSSGYAPGIANTACDGYCRCDLVPERMEDIEKEKAKLIKEMDREIDRAFEKGIKFDMSSGRRVLLKDYENVAGMYLCSYERIAYMESLIFKWKANTGNALPSEFFEKASIEKQIKWLRDNG